MNGSFKEEYWKATVKELNNLKDMDTCEVVKQIDNMDEINSIWAFKLKRFPDRLVKKFKACFCAKVMSLTLRNFFEKIPIRPKGPLKDNFTPQNNIGDHFSKVN